MQNVAGIIFFDGRLATEEILRAQLAAMQKPVDSAQEILLLGRAGFGCSSAADFLEEPCAIFQHQESQCSIVADALLTNRDELLQKLHMEGGSTDSQLILHTYLRWGSECVNHLFGDYAFVIWNGKEKCVFCARDHLGAAPLVYWHDPGKCFAFGTEVSTLLALSEFPKMINREKIADYLAGDICHGMDSQSTFFYAAKRLPSATTILGTSNKLETGVFWSLRNANPLSGLSESEYADLFLERFQQALYPRIQSSSPVGFALSGGLDSGSLFSVTRSLHSDSDTKERFMLFSLLDDSHESHWEVEGIRTHHSSFNGHSELLTPKDSSSAFQQFFSFVSSSNELFDLHNAAFFFSLFRPMQAAGVKVAIGGADGDLVTSGNPYALADLLQKGQLIELVKESAGYARHYGISHLKLILFFAVLPLVPPLARIVYSVRRKFLSPYDPGVFSLINPDFAIETRLFERLKVIEDERLAIGDAQNIQAAAICSATIQSTRERHRRLANWYGLDFRQPFLDAKLCEFCVSLPGQYKFHRGIEKLILRRAMKGILPESIRTQQSHGGGVGANFQYKFFLQFQDEICNFLKEGRSELADFIDVNYLQNEIKNFTGSPREESEERILRAFGLLTWLKSLKNLSI